MLGGAEVPTATGEQWGRKFESKVDYKLLLESVFKACAESTSPNAIIYVRTDARKFTFETTHDVLLVLRQPNVGG